MTENELYKLWCEKAVEDPDLQAELKSIEGDNDAIVDRFYRDLEFGTGGMRGVIGAGAYRLNIYTIRRATQGLADYVKEAFKDPAVAISYDSRIKSDVFARESAAVLAANGIKAYIYPELMPTPCLSWAVRALNCQAGIMVTASHNPAKYNGYKVYGDDGCQLTLDAANAVTAKIEKVDMFGGAKYMDFEQALKEGKVEYIKQDVIDRYLDKVYEQGIHTDLVAESGLKVVYTPLNGTGNKPVRAILKRIGIKEVTVVPEQELPDGNFPTCPFPNPEIKEALAKGLELCKSVKPDLLLATDPDCDRVGIAVPDPDGNYVLFSGNEVGAMMLNYTLSCRKANGNLPAKPVCVSTIVSSDLGTRIAEKYGCEMRRVLTGFKYIGEIIGWLEADGEKDRFIMGYEESYGYLCGTYARDKDAVVASMIICEMAAYYKKQGKSLLDVMNEIYAEFGYYRNRLLNYGFEGEAGMKFMNSVMDQLRSCPPTEIAGDKVLTVSDYKLSVQKNMTDGTESEIKLPKSNVLSYKLENGGSFIVRPSGTEPKIKVYTAAVGTVETTDAKLNEFEKAANAIMGK